MSTSYGIAHQSSFTQAARRNGIHLMFNGGENTQLAKVAMDQIQMVNDDVMVSLT